MNALAPTSKLCSIFVFDLISNPLEIKRQHKYIYIYNFSKHYKSTLFQLKKKKLFSDKKKKKKRKNNRYSKKALTATTFKLHIKNEKENTNLNNFLCMKISYQDL